MTESRAVSRREAILAAAAAVSCRTTQSAESDSAEGAPRSSCNADAGQLAGRSLQQLRNDYRKELFERSLPFWDRHGIDHEHGGFMCALDYDGTRVNTDKFHWYQGRGIWVYSYLYNHFGQDNRYLGVARRAVDFWLRFGRQKKGWWAERLSRAGEVLQPFRGDVYSAFTTAEGLQEYAWATGDDESRYRAVDLVKKGYEFVTREDYRDVYASQPGWRVQGIWIYLLNSCTQMLNRWDDNALSAIAEECVDAIMEQHFNPEIGLNNEFLEHDFSRLPDEANKCLVGHSIQALWHVMDEAVRQQDDVLYGVCADRVRRHLDVGWDHVYGGLCEWVNVNQFDHEWGPQRLGDQTIDLKISGEYNYVKSFWALNETLVATLHVYDRLGCDWAARYFSLAQDTADHTFRRDAPGQATYVLATDRKREFVPRSTRQDNYHPLRRLMRNLLVLERLAAVG